MPITRSIPKNAARMVRIIRNEVPRPKKLPQLHWSRLCFVRPGEALLSSCPMGLIPGAHQLPVTPSDLPDRISIQPWAIVAFLEWWDEQEDPAAATNAVWPRRKA